MEHNIITAIINLVNNPVLKVKSIYSEKNRANSTGEALEEYIKDLFAGTFAIDDENQRNLKISEVFSYLGNNSNPPDIQYIFKRDFSAKFNFMAIISEEKYLTFSNRERIESLSEEKTEASGRSKRLGELLLSETEKLLISESWV